MRELELKGIKVLWPQIASRVQVTARGVVSLAMTKVGRPQGSLSFKSQTIFLELTIFIRVMMKIKSAIYIEFQYTNNIHGEQNYISFASS